MVCIQVEFSPDGAPVDLVELVIGAWDDVANSACTAREMVTGIWTSRDRVKKSDDYTCACYMSVILLCEIPFSLEDIYPPKSDIYSI